MSSIKRHEESFCALMTKVKSLAELLGVNFHDGIGWDLKQMSYAYQVIRDLLPFDEDDRVILIEQPKLSGAWESCAHFLKPGECGVVSSIEMYEGRLSANIVFDNETWIDSKRVLQPVSSKHTFGLPLRILKKLDCGCGHQTKGS